MKNTRIMTAQWMVSVIAALLIVMPASLMAQVEPSEASETSKASETSATPVATPGEAPGEAGETAGKVAAESSIAGGVILNFEDAPLDAVLNELSARLGVVIVNPPRISSRVTIISRSPLNVDEAVEMLNTALKASGYAAVRSGRTLRIMTLEQAQKAGIPVRSGCDPQRIGTGDSMITQIIPIRYAEAAKLQEDLSGLIPEYAHITGNEASNTLILTASEADVRHIVEIVSTLDIQLSEANEVRVFQLEYADAEATSELIDDIFGADSSSSSNSGQSMRDRFMRRMMGGRGPGGQQDSSDSSGQDARVQQQKVNAGFDEQTNSVVVSAPPEIMLIIAEVVEQIDGNPTAEESIFIYPLTNAKAANLEEVLQDIFDEDSGSSNTNNSSFRGRGGFGGPPPMGGGDSSSSSSSGGDLAGKVYVVADEDTNSLLVRTAPKYFDRVRAILKELDRPTRQVLIKVLIAEVTHDNTFDLGAEFSVLNLNFGGGVGEFGTDFGLSTLSSGLVGRFVDNDFTATLRAMQQLGKLEVLSRPYLMGSENQTASITVGEEVPYITNSRTTDTSQTVNTVEYRDIGIILNVTPYIGPDGMVIMDVEQEISSTTGRTVTVSEDFEAEVYATRSAQTRVAVANGRTVVIGGLMQNNVSETKTQIPLLGSIPLLGNLFKRTERTSQKTELLIFLSPRTALTPDELSTVSSDTRKVADILNNTDKGNKFKKPVDDIFGINSSDEALEPKSGHSDEKDKSD